MFRQSITIALLLVAGALAADVAAHDSHDDGNKAEQRTNRIPTLAEPIWHANGVVFRSTVAAPLRLTVSGPKYIFKKTFTSEDPSFATNDTSGRPLQDGEYRYELREIVPRDHDIREALDTLPPSELDTLKEQWRREGRWPLSRQRIQHDIFHVVDGQVVLER